MYSIQCKVFGIYKEYDNATTYDGALQKANALNNNGWANVRIITPKEEIIQVYGEQIQYTTRHTFKYGNALSL